MLEQASRPVRPGPCGPGSPDGAVGVEHLGLLGWKSDGLQPESVEQSSQAEQPGQGSHGVCVSTQPSASRLAQFRGQSTFASRCCALAEGSRCTFSLTLRVGLSRAPSQPRRLPGDGPGEGRAAGRVQPPVHQVAAARGLVGTQTLAGCPGLQRLPCWWVGQCADVG